MYTSWNRPGRIPSYRAVASVAMLCLFSAAFGTAHAQVRTFEGPTYGGYPVSFCGLDPATCGEGVATAWCRSQRYDAATEWAGLGGTESTVTVRLEDGAICRGAACETFTSITCTRQQAEFRMPRLGGMGRATLIDPGGRSAAVAYQTVELDALIPGCHQREPGVYMCETVHEFQHCRTLMHQGQIFSCRAGLAFDGGFATTIAPKPGEYRMELDSDSEIRVERGRRGEGRAKGEANVEIAFRQPATQDTSWCLQRDRYVYHSTGPKGGIGEIDDTADCDAPVTATLEPHEDDVLVAYELCESFAAWGGELDHTVDFLVGALFHLGSGSPAFLQQYGGRTAILAPYLTVKAPIRIECRD